MFSKKKFFSKKWTKIKKIMNKKENIETNSKTRRKYLKYFGINLMMMYD